MRAKSFVVPTPPMFFRSTNDEDGWGAPSGVSVSWKEVQPTSPTISGRVKGWLAPVTPLQVRVAPQMNGTHAGSVHGPVETILTSNGVKQPLAFEVFFEAERVRLQGALYLLTGNTEEAEEVLQDAFIAIWERWDRVGAMADPTGYLYKTAMNRWRSQLRRAGRTARRVIGQTHGRDGFADVDDRVEIARALAALSPRRREAIIVTELLGYASADAGRVMGVADATVRRLAQDARAELRATLEVPDA
jgi:RNA polymerase sigma factor (sigma-70 family)